ncbi:HTH-type transcriptional repressor GlcR [compost metagenome]
MDSNEPECELKKRMIQQGSQVILLVDHTKFDKASFVQLSDLEQIHVLVTDDKPSDDWLAKLAELGIEVIY